MIVCMLNPVFKHTVRYVDDIDAVERNVEPPMGGLVCDLLWADPMRIELPEGQTEETQDEIMEGLLSATFVPNTARDCSYVDEHLYNIQCSEICTLIYEKLHTEA